MNNENKVPVFEDPRDLTNEAEAVILWSRLVTAVCETSRHIEQTSQGAPARDILPAVKAQYIKACKAFLDKGGFSQAAPELVPVQHAAGPALKPYVGADGRAGTLGPQ